MAKKTLTKRYIEQNVLEAAIERIEYIYQNFDHVCVSFSGGKDSTALLNLTIMVAKRLNRLPVHAIFFDEEAIHPPTIEYVERVRQDPNVQLDWFCLPFKHRNACSSEQPWWYTWNPDKKDVWVREMPANVITEHPMFRKGMPVPDFAPRIQPLSRGKVAQLIGLRTQESLRRYRVVTSRIDDNYINMHAKQKNVYNCYPIYDWSSKDVWRLVAEYGLDYNRTYDVFNRTGMHNKLLQQRVCPPFGEQPLQGLWLYQECFPQMWAKMINRVPGAATAARYAKTSLYNSKTKPDQLTWEAYVTLLLKNSGDRAALRPIINKAIRAHYSKTDRPIPEKTPDIMSGASWKYIAMIAAKGDYKARYVTAMTTQSERLSEFKQATTLYYENRKHFSIFESATELLTVLYARESYIQKTLKDKYAYFTQHRSEIYQMLENKGLYRK